MSDVQFARIETASHGPLSLEYRWLNPELADAPLLVFLHEGLGSVAMWKDWPQQLCDAGGFRGLVYSRNGYGRSTPRPHGEKWPVDFMHRQAREVLPAFLDAVGIGPEQAERVWLVGHSDGGSISLLFSAAFPDRLAGAVVLAPHLFVEDLSVQSIAKTKTVYETTDLRTKLGRYHDDVDSAFWGWNDIWLDPAFREWNLVGAVASISKPLLAIQGEDDEYGTMAQMDSIAAHVAHATVVKLPACGHSPHRDAPVPLGEAIVAFIGRHHPSANRQAA
ncbi:alpha/beta fold hydrolase [Pandoraea terrigena]|uniref:2-succinyl-6-hydroxy-2, 4-cyclohexadiene-1-carboxylate synthase n=1 Tax=Pandoraea terrigena TaxID=2508292 RepID=A0A5E4X1P0_9BURK|nr:alpha/beta hydrolase [Pandoraea terrigena]VVE30184.1 2-succinyl-6-hydroxy-2, 4-cyclohexadiene-1-carboxylate synthase [Pandoraea terrigena]